MYRQEFPFADGSPMRELASFYRECSAAAGAWGAAGGAVASSAELRAQTEAQLRAAELAAPDFDRLLAAMAQDPRRARRTP